MNPDADVTYQTVNLFSSDKCFICLHSMKPHYNSKVRTYHCSTCIKYIYLYQNCTDSVVLISKSAQHFMYNFGKDRCTRYIWSNDMFVLWNRIFLHFKKIENADYTSFKYSILLFINRLIFDVMNIQNNQPLEFK